MSGEEPRTAALMREALERITALQARVRTLESAHREPIAIVGLGCRFPGAPSPDAFWELLREGRDAITDIPADRWDREAYYDPRPEAAGRITTRWGGFLADLDRFDAAFFGISPREARQLDPQQRLLLEVTWEALEHAGIAPDSLAGSAGGVFIGIGGVDYYQRLTAGSPDAIDAYVASGNAHSTASGRLAFLLNLHGPCLSLDTACSSSLVATHLACRSLRERECDLAIAGGANVILSPSIHLNHSRARMLAPDGRCKVFDARADGFVRSEGCGIVVLKRLADAVAAGDRVLAIVRGSAVNQDGRTSALTVPNGTAQRGVVRAALADAGLSPADIAYVEAHGTGTSLGDPIELGALAAVFGGQRDAPLAVGSVKANIGHLEAAAGVAGLLKVVLAMQHREWPPQLHLHTPNPRLDWHQLAIRVPTTLSPWPATGEVVRAGVSSFGFGGTNAHVVVEAPPPAPAIAPVNDEILLLSAKTAPALRALASACAAHFRDRADEELGPACWTAATGRNHFEHRLALRAESVQGVRARLERAARGDTAEGVWMTPDAGAEPGRLAFLFTGQGAQYWGMGRALYDRHEGFRAALDECAAAFDPHLDRPLLDVLFAEGGRSVIDQTAFTQPALFAFEYAMTALWRGFGVRPDVVLGHSLGEYVAAHVAGVLTLADAARLVAARGRLMQQQPAGAMAVLLTDLARAEACIAPGEAVSIAAINGPAQIVVSGPAGAVTRVRTCAAQQRIATRALEVSHAFHSAMMEPILGELTDLARATTSAPPAIDVISNLTGAVIGAEMCEPGYWAEHARRPVRFAQGVQAAWDLGCRTFIEVGPDAPLSGLAAATLGVDAGAWIASARRGREPWPVLMAAAARAHVAGVRLDWARGLGRAPGPRVALPTYPFERERHWSDAAMPIAPAPGASGATLPTPRPELQHEVVWEPASTPDTGASAARPLPERWVVLAGTPETASLVAGWLDASDVRSTSAVVAGDLESGRAREVCAAAGPASGGIVYCALESFAIDTPVDVLMRAATRHVANVATLLRELSSADRAAARLWVMTRGAAPVPTAGGVRSDRVPPLVAAALWGLGPVAALEHPAAWGGLVDLDDEAPTPSLLSRALAGEHDQAAIRGADLLAPRLRPVANATPGAVPASALPIRPDGAYLVTGGLGALGLDVADWLADRGARALVLAGRRRPGEIAGERLWRLRDRGVDVRVEALDVSRAADMRAFFEAWPAGRPLCGVVHAAGANGSALLTALDAGEIARVMAPKLAGSWLLHAHAQSQPLDFFVGFSSIAAVWGSRGQAHYAAANAALDAVVAYRRSLGLPAVSLQWGPWRDRGMATADVGERLARVGVRPMAAADAMASLERMLVDSLTPDRSRAPMSRVVADVDWGPFLELYQVRRRAPLFRGYATGAAPDTPPAGDGARADRLAAIRVQGPIEGRRTLLALVQGEVRRVLSLPESRTPASHQGFFTIGLDSLMALELRQRLSTALDVALPSTAAFDYPTIRDLAEYLAREMAGFPAQAMAAGASHVAAAPDVPAGEVSVAASLTRLERLIQRR